MTQPFTPERWAFEITHLLNAVLGADRFPVDIATVALEYTAHRFADAPIIGVKGGDLPGFEGALIKSTGKRSGWGIIYNDRISSKGRINFTLAHELGHFLLHRLAYPDGFQCGEQDVVRWDSEYGQVEHQANVFAATILMPLDDFRSQIPETTKVDLDMIANCANRYGVSLMAATLRWLSYTQKRAVLVVSRDGFILWAKSSDAALRTGAYFRTTTGPIEIPAASLAAQQELLVDGAGALDHNAGVWFREPVREMTVFAELHDFSLSLLLLDDARPSISFDAADESDLLDKMMPPTARREW
ncbi:ImmA/IrrE family metallo-endopeptidase [Asticcacaulis benevestitus]|uniref:IrrE N-terminal-like domain-containing protein n=1 Tax=Asticcacaulis benevestitus DSM 16100 = ATCC BAA-896 TaxID=1121022 RepID=V4PCI3_9CAUL|nr:ImmA/IrrE family metallo-endopeptidase [Asticcacaulis benevestitus]ESQ83010.1 hypothetical protein ABENE_20595 [Asticcacaulis benevestitus DSM 16100 = ATCC BAA-896]